MLIINLGYYASVYIHFSFSFLCIVLYSTMMFQFIDPCISFWLGTWQTYVVKEQSVWHKIDKTTPIEYAATVIVNPLTALRMLDDFVELKSGTAPTLVFLYSYGTLNA